MERVDKLFVRLWLLVYILLLYNSYNQNMKYVRYFSHNVVAITIPMLLTVESKSQLAGVIAHELAHIHLKHTTASSHDMVDEYDADLLSVYYMKKAGYNICDIKNFWKVMGRNFLSLKPSSHPNAQTRAFYMDFPECKGYQIKQEPVNVDDAREIFNNLNKHVAGIDRYRTKFRVVLHMSINAFAWTVFKTKN